MTLATFVSQPGSPAAVTPTPFQLTAWQEAERLALYHCEVRGATAWPLRQHPRIALAKSRTGTRMWGPDIEAASNWAGQEQYFMFDVKSQAYWRDGPAALTWTVNEDALVGMFRHMQLNDVPDESAWFLLIPFGGGTPYVASMDDLVDLPIEQGDHAFRRISAMDARLRTLDCVLGPVNPWTARTA